MVSRTDGVTAASARAEGVTVADASPLPHHLALTSTAADRRAVTRPGCARHDARDDLIGIGLADFRTSPRPSHHSHTGRRRRPPCRSSTRDPVKLGSSTSPAPVSTAAVIRRTLATYRCALV